MTTNRALEHISEIIFGDLINLKCLFPNVILPCLLKQYHYFQINEDAYKYIIIYIFRLSKKKPKFTLEMVLVIKF